MDKPDDRLPTWDRDPAEDPQPSSAIATFGGSALGGAYATRGLENFMRHPWDGVDRRGRIIAYLVALVITGPFALVWAISATPSTFKGWVFFALVFGLSYRLDVAVVARIYALVMRIRRTSD